MSIVRVFRAEVVEGKEDEFEDFFLREALPSIRACQGLVSVQVGLPRPESPRSFLMVTTWSDLDALKGFAGEAWSRAVIDPREAHLLAEVGIDHYVEAAGGIVGAR